MQELTEKKKKKKNVNARIDRKKKKKKKKNVKFLSYLYFGERRNVQA